MNLQFSLIEKLWQTFWRYSPSTPPDGTTVNEPRSVNVLSLCTDCYNNIVEVSNNGIDIAGFTIRVKIFSCYGAF